MNFLRVGDLVILPSYGIREDEEARRIIEQVLPGTALAQVDCSALSMEGGALNCVTWSSSLLTNKFVICCIDS